MSVDLRKHPGLAQKVAAHERQMAAKPISLAQARELALGALQAAEARRAAYTDQPRRVASIMVELPLPASELSPNYSAWTERKKRARVHETKNARISSKLRVLVACGFDPPRWERAVVNTHWFFCRNGCGDTTNLQASLKATFDGLQDAGVIVNDSGLRHGTIVLDIDKYRPRVELTIEPIL